MGIETERLKAMLAALKERRFVREYHHSDVLTAILSELIFLREAGWQDISTAKQDHREPDILLYSHHYDQAGRLVEYHTVGRWAVGTGPNARLDGWEGAEGVHPDGFFTHWKPLTSPDNTPPSTESNSDA
jgi:hypothetical protein